MNILSAEGLSKSYGTKQLFHNLSLHISEGERIGLIGVNGSGKSTLLKVLAGVEPADQGHIMTGNRFKIEYVPQAPPYEPEDTVLEHIFKGDQPIIQLLREYEQALQLLAKQPQSESLQQQVMALSGRMDSADAWQLESEAKKILSQLGIEQFESRMGSLSGGQRKRVCLAAALIRPSDLLILDEPTNHIDIDAVLWLETYLTKRQNALLMITHDRYFLDRTVDQIVELEQGSLFSYQGNYSDYLQQKAVRIEQQEATAEKQQNLFRRELAWMRKGAKARTTKQKARIDRFEALKDDMDRPQSEKLELSLSSQRLGKKVIELEHIAVQAGNQLLFKQLDLIIQRHSRIGIIGPNGSGKTTLLKLLKGQIEPDEGCVERGATVQIGYFSQENEHMDEDQRVLEYIQEAASYIETADGSRISAGQMLERFLFPSALQWTPIAKLSGGERRRLYLLRILMSAPNVLLLDEPTNDLDVQTLAILEEFLDQFAGAVVAVSHDRYFLDRTTEVILSFEPDHRIRHLWMSASEALAARTGTYEQTEQVQPSVQSAQSPGRDRKQHQLKFSYKEEQEYETIDEKIEQTEQQLAQTEEDMAACGSDFERLQSLTEQQQSLEEQLEQLMERWTYLNELAEKIEAERSGR